MKRGIRYHMLGWLALVTVPAMAAGFLAISVIDKRLSERIEADLANALRLEAARIEKELHDYKRDAIALASGKHVKDFISGMNSWHEGNLSATRVIGGYDGFDIVNPSRDRPLQQLGIALQKKSQSTGAEVAELRMVASSGQLLAQTNAFGWNDPYDPELLVKTLASGEAMFGNAFRNTAGEDRLGLIVPVTDDASQVVGGLVLEMNLAPVVDLVVEHEGFGESSESHIAQPTPTGDAELITLMRFKRDAAFKLVVPKTKNLPINTSLLVPDSTVVRSKDYRSVDSILALKTLPYTNWGLVVKIDSSEAFAPVAEVRTILSIAFCASILLVIASWFIYLRPLAQRLLQASQAAGRVAAGDYAFQIADKTGDEISDMSNSIDRLAADLSADIALRSEAERRLKYQATHDELTGLFNRKHGSGLIDKIDTLKSMPDTGVLFMDLDGFKPVNDSHGHAAGDTVLMEVGRRLEATIGSRGLVSRWGGDEFVVVIPRCTLAKANQIAEQIEASLLKPIISKEGAHSIGCSIGVSSSSEGGRVSDALVRADERMYQVKHTHHGDRRVQQNGNNIVEAALENSQVEVWYQPIVQTADTGQIIIKAVEALVRIRLDNGEVLPPNQFLPDIHESPVGRKLDHFILEQALQSLARWRSAGEVAPEFAMFVNVDGATIRNPDLASLLNSILTRLDLPPSSLVLELSEQTTELDEAILKQVRSIGVRIALDDLGVMCANFDRLIDIHPEIAKIDRRWIAMSGGNQSHNTRTVLTRMLEICKELRIAVVIEGIEAAEEIAGIDVSQQGYLLQGYYFYKPLEEEPLRALQLGEHPDRNNTAAHHPNTKNAA